MGEKKGREEKGGLTRFSGVVTGLIVPLSDTPNNIE